MSKVIVIAHQKGGVGKSTIASNIAVEVAKKHSIKIIDLDFQKSLTYFNNKRASKKLEPLNIVNVANIDELKNILNNENGVFLIDTGGFDADMNRLAIAGADLLLTPVSDAEIEQVGLLAFREIIRDIRKHRPSLQASILLNRIHQWANASLNDIYEFVSANPEFVIFPHILRDRADYKKAFSEGKSVVEYKSNATNEVSQMVDEILNFIESK